MNVECRSKDILYVVEDGQMNRRRLAVVTGFAKAFAKFEYLLTLRRCIMWTVVGNLWILHHYIWSSIFQVCDVYIWFFRRENKAVTSCMRCTWWELLVVTKKCSPNSAYFIGLEVQEGDFKVNRREWLVLSSFSELFCTLHGSWSSEENQNTLLLVKTNVLWVKDRDVVRFRYQVVSRHKSNIDCGALFLLPYKILSLLWSLSTYKLYRHF